MTAPQNQFPVQTWNAQEAAIFCKTRERHGLLSNMAAAMPIKDPETGLTFQSSEGLYQARKFPGNPELQARIATAGSGYAAKQTAYQSGQEPHADWDEVKAEIMLAVLRLKLQQHPETFGQALQETAGRPIVEYSTKGDQFWGATPAGPGRYQGRNVLGVLLTRLRDETNPAAAPVEENPAQAVLNSQGGSIFFRKTNPPPATTKAASIFEQAALAATLAAASQPAEPAAPAATSAVAQGPTLVSSQASSQETFPRIEYNVRPDQQAPLPAATGDPSAVFLMDDSGSAAAPAADRQQGRSSIPENFGKTRVSAINPQTLLSAGNGFMQDYHGSLNPYAGCSFGCQYCYASNFTRNPEDQETWGQWVQVKANLDALMDQVKPGDWNDLDIYMSTVTDPYQPIERKLQLTRGLLTRLLAEHPRLRLVVQTRSPLAVRDLDLFQAIKAGGGQVQVNFTVTTDDEEIRKTYEPGCPSIPARLKAAAAVQAAGVQTAITTTPMLPLGNIEDFLNQLEATGVTRFIIQPFKLALDDQAGRFTARTDRKAVELTAAYYGLPAAAAIARYNQEYQENRRRFLARFPQAGEGQPGFKPPFAVKTQVSQAAAGRQNNLFLS